MTLYEGNHARLRQLLGDLRSLPDALISSSLRDPEIYVTRTSVSRYTSDLRMTYRLALGGTCVATPDLLVRVYHDARLAETLECSEHMKWLLHGRPATPRRAIGERWRLNILLNKWVEHCLDHGHRFGRVSADIARP